METESLTHTPNKKEYSFPDYINDGFKNWAIETCNKTGIDKWVQVSSPKGGEVSIHVTETGEKILILKRPETDNFKLSTAKYNISTGERIDDFDTDTTTDNIQTSTKHLTDEIIES